MVKKVLRSKALYGRITLDMLLKGLRAEDAYALIGRKRSKEEALKYLLVFGGVPKYLEDINPNRSFNHNINRLCFSPHSTMIHEVSRTFYSQFRETRSYLKIINLLKGGLFTANEISEKAGIPLITMCEVKHQKSKISTKVIPVMERKCALLKTPRGYALEKALISLYGSENALRDSDYFNHFVTLEDIFPDR
ncbi:MAG: hypothetical protein GY850_33500 [bacterium]|nr:hypothetical protein [bacterium]